MHLAEGVLDKLCSQIHNACRTAGPLDLRQAAAVEARICLDLRIGAALTRQQTLGLQGRIAELAENIISYGTFYTCSLLSLQRTEPPFSPNQVHASSQPSDLS